MKTIFFSLAFAALVSLTFSSCDSSEAAPLSYQIDSANADLKLTTTIPLTGVKGRIDHMAYDSAGQKLFICALGNGSVEVVDLKSEKVIHSFKNLAEPQGVAFDAEKKRIFVACGNDGYLRVFDIEKFTQTDSLKIGSDADNVRYDKIAKRIYVGYDGGLAVVNAVNMKLISNTELDGHPESFQLDKMSAQLFVNVPDAYEIEVIDLKKSTDPVKWKLNEARDNFPMALDERGNRLFVACRHPSEILVIDKNSGKILSTVNCSGDADDIYYDAASKELITSCGQGKLEMFKEKENNTFSLLSSISTRTEARTSLLVPAENKYFLVLPAMTGKTAELRIYNLN